jgi:hypothetical protein
MEKVIGEVIHSPQSRGDSPVHMILGVADIAGFACESTLDTMAKKRKHEARLKFNLVRL